MFDLSSITGVILLLALFGVQLAIGVAVGARLPKRKRANAPDEQSQAYVKELQAWASRVNEQVTQHNDRVQEIQDDLAVEDGPFSAAAGELLGANEMLLLQLASARQELAEQAKELKVQTHEARTDPLTQLSNRRAFDEELDRRFAQWRRQHSPLSVLLVDVDHFKKFNDTYGHQTGDRVLQQVAAQLKWTMRDMDLVARYGGEEFVALLPGTGLSDAKIAAERVRKAVEAAIVKHLDGELRVTASVGLAQALPGDDPASLVGRADSALYAAKQGGRNRGYFHSGSECLPIECAAGETPAPPQPRPAPPLLDFADSPVAEAPIVEGETSVQTEERRRHCRKQFAASQFIAPCVKGRLPTPGAFREVHCVDVSSAGFSYLTEAFPDTDSLVVEFGVPPSLIYLSARVVHCTRLSEVGDTKYKIGCRFTGRLQL